LEWFSAGDGAPFPVEPAPGLFTGVTVVLSFLASAYLEESYFRVYLTARLPGGQTWRASLFGSFLFALCHLYEGPWGAANAFCSGLFLCRLYCRRPHLHGLACAHAAYNLLVTYF